MKQAAESTYLYAVTAPHLPLDMTALPGILDGAGLSGVPQCISDGPLGAVVSLYDGKKVRPERKNLAAHQGVLRALMGRGIPFLPVAFGVVVPSAQDLLALLRANQEAFVRDLKRLSGKVEMGLKVLWDVPNIFEFFVFQNPELAKFRDQVLEIPEGVSREEKIALGQAFEMLLRETRTQHEETVRRELGTCVLEFQADPPRGEKMILNLSCLIERKQEKAFEQAVLRAASCFDDNYAFDYSGPWPPYHFVSVSLPEPAMSELAR